jgi:hypothetical protein
MNNRMAICIATTMWPGWRVCPDTINDTAKLGPYPEYVVSGEKTMNAYQKLFEQAKHPILAYIHDDVSIHEPGWDGRVLREFDDPSVGVVGFGGAIAQGSTGMYDRPFDPGCLGRIGFRSNMRDWQRHGALFEGECDVAVLDGFSLIVRREILEKMGGWIHPFQYWIYDYMLCCWAHRLGYRVRLVGVSCHHIGGVGYNARPDLAGPWEDGLAANKWIFDNFSDVLPWSEEGK